MIYEYFRIALRSLARRKLRAWLTLLGIVIGITSVVALVGLGQGLQVAISGIFGGLGTDFLSVTATGGFGPPGSGVINPLTADNVEKIKKIHGVEEAAGRVIEPGKLIYNKKITFGYAGSLPEDVDEQRLIIDALNIEMDEGRFLRSTDNKKVMLGNAFKTMGEYFGKDIVIGSKVEIQDETFEVVGIIDKLGSPLFDSVVWMNDKDLRDIFDLDPDELDAIAIRVTDEQNIPGVVEDIEKYLRRDRDVKVGEEDFSVQSPQDALDSVNSTLGAVNIFVYVIAGISIIVGGIGIMNTMFMSVTERTKDIGIMKSIGARNSVIFQLFFIESGLLGSVGGLVGAIIGSAIAMAGAAGLKSFLGDNLDISAQIGFGLFFGSVAGSFLIGSIFGIIPAIRASKLHPVDALRYRKC